MHQMSKKSVQISLHPINTQLTTPSQWFANDNQKTSHFHNSVRIVESLIKKNFQIDQHHSAKNCPQIVLEQANNF